MKLDIDNIKRGDQNTLDLKFILDPYSIDFYGDTIYIISPIDVSGRLYVVDYKLYISLKIKADMQANCNRCLESFIYPFNSSIDAEIIHKDLFKCENDEADEDIIYYEDGMLDLKRLIKEHIIMNIPIKLVCDEVCQGLCAKCGTKLGKDSCSCNSMQYYEDNIDPRLAKLKMLLEED